MRGCMSRAGRLKVGSRRPRSARRRDISGLEAWRRSLAVVMIGLLMTMDAWMIWIVLAVVLAAAELVWPSLLLAPFAAGAVLGAVSESAGFGSGAVLVAFVVTSGLLLSV